ncbi:hypothetical protein EDD16DRAFT_1469286 [Pisolithus croceorrhizus]|nr:hypothetical protein EDD16DRAFT_1469286 [Pisolithus croceorrhizus]
MPPPKVEPRHRLTFATSSVRNEGDKFYYGIVARFWHPHPTRLNNYDYEARVVTCVAEIEFPPKEGKVRLNAPHAEGEWIRASDFLMIGPESGGTLIIADGLVKVDDEDKVPLAEYHPYKRHFFVFRMSHHTWLEVKPEAAVTLQKIIG